MSEKQELNLDNKLLKPLKDNLEQSINLLTKNAILTKKESEITLKINIGINKRCDKEKEWLEPKYEYQLKEKIKEAKSDFKDDLGFNYSIEIDKENNILVQNINEQASLFDEEEKQEDGEETEEF